MTFQYLKVSCIPAIGHVCDISIPESFMYICYRYISIPESFMYTCYRSRIGHFNTWQCHALPAIGYVHHISRNDTWNLFSTVADILQHIPSKVPDIDCSWHFMVLYLGKLPIMSTYVIIFPGKFLYLVEPSCLWVRPLWFQGLQL